MKSTTTTGSTSTIYVGQLALDMYDSTHKDLIWRGVASKKPSIQTGHGRRRSPYE